MFGTSRESHQRNLQQLWETHVFTWVERPGETGIERQKQAVDVLASRRRQYEEAVARGEKEEALRIAVEARAVWTLLAIETGAWTVEVPALLLSIVNGEVTGERASKGNAERLALESHLFLQEDAITEPLRRVIDPVPMMLPQWLFQSLRNAIAALEFGEVQPLVQPQPSKRQGPAWTWISSVSARSNTFTTFMARA